MKLTRPSRLIVALVVLISMLFMQLAVAGYVCPGFKIAQVSESVSMEVDQAMVGCQGMDTVQPSLCHANDQAGNQSLDKPELPHVQPFMAAALTLVIQNVALTYSPISTQPESLLLTRTTAPPLSIRNCCFRI